MTITIDPNIGDVVGKVGDIIDKTHTSEEERLEQQFKRQELHDKALARQADINKIEAAHSSLFVAGWRPFIGWVGGFGLAWAVFLEPMLSWLLAIFAPEIQPHVPNKDMLDFLFYILTAMMGIGFVSRTAEKLGGVARTTMKDQTSEVLINRSPNAGVDSLQHGKF